MSELCKITAPLIPPLPHSVQDVQEPVLNLNDRTGNGTWQFLFSVVDGVPAPQESVQDFDFGCMPQQGWQPIVVPGELAMQGIEIINNNEYYYKRQVEVPADFAQKQMLLCFDGVYSQARCWVDGHFVGSHNGGFTSWMCDITPFVQAGSSFTLVVGVADIEGSAEGIYNPKRRKLGNPAWASFYAHHNIGGILRDVLLLALPQTSIARLYTDTRFDKDFCDAELSITTQLSGEKSGASVRFELYWKDELVACATQAEGSDTTIIPMTAPYQWDAEHPNLYTLFAILEKDGVVQEKVRQLVGFREIHYGGRDGTDPARVYVNGKEIKLRGACRHDVSTCGGRSTSPEEDWQEIRAFREANMNHIRTSHYPPSRHLLEACDVLGMYVEEENSVCFQGANANVVRAEAHEFVQPFTEMVERDRNHPCVIIWSLGNESGFQATTAFRTEFDYIKATDTSRPIIFSFPHTVETMPLPFDIFSRHYERVDGVLGRPDMPVLHDEFAHLSCYNIDEQKRDPNVRNFWGTGLKSAWEKIFVTRGALGADLWCGIDDVFTLPDNVDGCWSRHGHGHWAGYGEWGSVLDCHRRLKPEAYLTKKAYSPIRVDEEKAMKVGKQLIIPIKNWFDHTNFSEVELRCTIGDKTVSADMPEIAPHQEGVLVLEQDWTGVDSVRLDFYVGEQLVEACCIPLVKKEYVQSPACTKAPTLEQTDSEIVVSAGDVTFRFSKRGACLQSASYKDQVVLTGGPHLNLQGKDLGYWVGERQPYAAVENDHVLVVLQGSYTKLAWVQFLFYIYGDGRFNVTYQLGECWVQDKLSEMGIRLDLPQSVTQVSWERDALYSLYPENHIGRACGTANRVHKAALEAGYGAAPTWDWKDDMFNAFLCAADDPSNGQATNDFKAMRENIRSYTVHFEDGQGCVSVLAQGDAAARVDLTKGVQLVANHHWCYPDLGWGNDTGKAIGDIGTGLGGYACFKIEKDTH